MRQAQQRKIEVWADWEELGRMMRFGALYSTPSRGKEIFSFEYDPAWLKSGNAQLLDPNLQLFSGPQYSTVDKANFGLFLDSAPDRWGRMLMDRREAQLARAANRPRRPLHESDYLLGVFDKHRMGALRFRLEGSSVFLDNNEAIASPPWTSLRELEHASLEIEREGAERNPSYDKWLRMLIAPGGSLGGARPKASVIDENGQLWIAKFPSKKDLYDLGAWEYVAHQLAFKAGLNVATSMVRTFNTKHHTYLTKRFDRSARGGRIHFASAMTLLGRSDGDDATSGASYLELAALLSRQSASPDRDLHELWRRIVFYIWTLAILGR